MADKDGLSAALVVADMAARAKHEGRSLLDRLDELECSLGVHTTGQWSVRLPGSDAPDVLAALMARLRASPPARLAGLEVTGVRDLAQGDGELPPSDVLVLQLGRGGARRVAPERHRAQAQGLPRGDDRPRAPSRTWARPGGRPGPGSRSSATKSPTLVTGAHERTTRQRPGRLVLSPEVAQARRDGKPLVALESTIIAHGLPRPRNLEVARELEAIVREEGACPATVAVLDGVPRIGLETDELARVAAGH